MKVRVEGYCDIYIKHFIHTEATAESSSRGGSAGY